MKSKKDFGLFLYDYNVIKTIRGIIPVSILHKSIAGRYRPVRVADGPITARYRFMKNASWDYYSGGHIFTTLMRRCVKVMCLLGRNRYYEGTTAFFQETHSTYHLPLCPQIIKQSDFKFSCTSYLSWFCHYENMTIQIY